MIIVSQDKEEIINFDLVASIFIYEETKIIAQCPHIKNFSMILGIYKTKERAEEVLEEIVDLFEDEEMLQINKSSLNNLDELSGPKYILRPVHRPKVYEMPKE